MKSYVILTTSVGDMGGAQMYTENKVRYLKELGWNVQVYFPIKSNTQILPFLSEYEGNIINNLLFYRPSYVPRYHYNRIVSRIRSKVIGSDEIVIESHTLPFAYWGEKIASDLKAKHIVNFLEEPIIDMSSKELDFFEFKLRKWEFMNASERNLRRIFKNTFKDEFLQYVNNVDFVCSNVACSNNETQGKFVFKETDFTILSIGRLEKPYVKGMTQSICEFIISHGNYNFNVIYVGGSPNGIIEEDIKKSFSNINNSNLYMLGFQYPIPQEVITAANVAIGTANAALVTADSGIPTITMDIDDYQPIGVLGVTTCNRFLREKEPIVDLSVWLEEILIEGKYDKCPCYSQSGTEVHIKEELEKQISFVYKCPADNIYYDINAVFDTPFSFIRKLKWAAHTYLHI